jgi:hypothetical protein
VAIITVISNQSLSRIPPEQVTVCRDEVSTCRYDGLVGMYGVGRCQQWACFISRRWRLAQTGPGNRRQAPDRSPRDSVALAPGARSALWFCRLQVRQRGGLDCQKGSMCALYDDAYHLKLCHARRLYTLPSLSFFFQGAILLW